MRVVKGPLCQSEYPALPLPGPSLEVMHTRRIWVKGWGVMGYKEGTGVGLPNPEHWRSGDRQHS